MIANNMRVFNQELLKYIPEHKIYVEMFGSAGALLFTKPPSQVEVYNDIDSNLIKLFEVLRNVVKLQSFSRIANFPDSFMGSESQDEEGTQDWAFYVRLHEWFSRVRSVLDDSNVYRSHKHVQRIIHNVRGHGSKWLEDVDGLEQLYARMLRVQIEHYDWRKIFDIYDRPHTFFYCNFLADYCAGMLPEEVDEFIERADAIKGMAMVVGTNGIRDKLQDHGWHCIIIEDVVAPVIFVNYAHSIKII